MMAEPSNFPLLTSPELTMSEERKEDIGAILALILAARLAPRSTRVVTKYGTGLAVDLESLSVKATPLVVTNFLPLPFGFTPPSTYGLPPNFYLPPGVGTHLPSFIPGANEQMAEAQDKYLADRIAKEIAERNLARKTIQGLRVDELEAVVDSFAATRAKTGAAKTVFQDEVERALAEKRAEQAYLKSLGPTPLQQRLQLEAQQDAKKKNPPPPTTQQTPVGGIGVAIGQDVVPGGHKGGIVTLPSGQKVGVGAGPPLATQGSQQPSSTPVVTPAILPGLYITGPDGKRVRIDSGPPPKTRPPSGFVEVPGGSSAQPSSTPGGGPSTPKSRLDKFTKDFRGGPFPDRFFQRVEGDP